MTGGVHRFMAPRRVVALRVVEGLQRRKLDSVLRSRVVGLSSAMPNRDAERAEEGVGVRDPLGRR